MAEEEKMQETVPKEESAAPKSKKGRKVRKRGKVQRKGKKHFSVNVSEAYKGKIENCPRCGPGTRIARHKNRKNCGKCGYTELKTNEKTSI